MKMIATLLAVIMFFYLGVSTAQNKVNREAVALERQSTQLLTTPRNLALVSVSNISKGL